MCPSALWAVPGGSYTGHVLIDDRLTLMAIVMNKLGEHLLGVCVSCWGWQGHILTSLCEDIRHREGIKKEGQRKRKRNEEDKGKKGKEKEKRDEKEKR